MAHINLENRTNLSNWSAVVEKFKSIFENDNIDVSEVTVSASIYGLKIVPKNIDTGYLQIEQEVGNSNNIIDSFYAVDGNGNKTLMGVIASHTTDDYAHTLELAGNGIFVSFTTQVATAANHAYDVMTVTAPWVAILDSGNILCSNAQGNNTGGLWIFSDGIASIPKFPSNYSGTYIGLCPMIINSDSALQLRRHYDYENNRFFNDVFIETVGAYVDADNATNAYYHKIKMATLSDKKYYLIPCGNNAHYGAGYGHIALEARAES